MAVSRAAVQKTSWFRSGLSIRPETVRVEHDSLSVVVSLNKLSLIERHVINDVVSCRKRRSGGRGDELSISCRGVPLDGATAVPRYVTLRYVELVRRRNLNGPKTRR